MDDDLPYRAEYAKSGRSSCKECKETINKDQLRLAVMIKAPKFDGKMPVWHHVDCFFKENHLTSVGDFANYQTLREEDQQLIKKKLEAADSAGTPTPSEKGKDKKKKEKKAAPAENRGLLDFSVEYAKSSRSACKFCLENIAKKQVRISKIIYDSDSARRYGPQPGFHHVDCFVKNRDELGYTEAADQLPGFSTLSDEDKQMLMEKIKPIGNGTKRKQEEAAAAPVKKAKVSDEEEKALAEKKTRRSSSSSSC